MYYWLWLGIRFWAWQGHHKICHRKYLVKKLIQTFLLILFNVMFIVSASYYLSGCKAEESAEIARVDQSGKQHPWTNLDWNNEPENFHFAIVADRTGSERTGVFEQSIEKLNLLQPEFVMSVGDLIDGYIEDPDQINQQWDELDEFVSRLEMPFFYVPGNHDLTNQIQQDVWKDRFGPTYYHFVYRDVLFLCLNGEERFDAHRSSFYSEEQREFVLKTLLENSDVRWTFVFMHKPVWAYDAYGKESGWSEIEAMLSGRKHTVFAGHKHFYQHYDRNNSNYIQLATTGGGSGLNGPLYSEFDHVAWVTMTDDGPVVANIMLEGIWDEDFGVDDIQKYLNLTLNGTAVRSENKLDKDKIQTGMQLLFRAFNKFDIPMKVTLTFNSGKHFGFNPWRIERNISPNSVEKIGTQLQVNLLSETDKEELVKELKPLNANYTITYDFEKYGKITVEGSVDFYD